MNDNDTIKDRAPGVWAVWVDPDVAEGDTPGLYISSIHDTELDALREANRSRRFVTYVHFGQDAFETT